MKMEMELKYIELAPRVTKEREVFNKPKTKRKGNQLFQKIKVGVGIAAFVLIIGLAGTSDLESQTTYMVKATAVNEHFLVSQEGIEIYSDIALKEGKEYKVTLDNETDEMKKIKEVR